LKEIIKSISRLSISSILNIVTSIVKSKILAVVAGPAGVGIYSQFVNLSALTTSVMPIGSIGLVNYTSNYYEKNRVTELGIIIGYFLKRNIIISIVIGLVMIFFADSLSYLLFSDSGFKNLIILFSLFIPLNLLLSFTDIYLKGIRKLNVYVLFLSLNSITSTIITILLIYLYSVKGAIYGLIISIALNLVIGLFILKKNKLVIKLSFKGKIDNKVKKNIYALGLGSIVTLISQNLTILTIKAILADESGLDSVGIFQSVYSISAAYFGIFFALMGSYSIPKISTLESLSDLINELNTTVRFLLLVYTPIILSIFVLRIIVISLLYSSKFMDAQYLLVFQLPAELFRALSWVIGLWLIPKFKIKQWILFDLSFYTIFLLLFYFLIKYCDIGVLAVSVSYLISYVVYLVINYFYAVQQINFSLDKNNKKMISVSIFLILCMFTLSFYYIYVSYFMLIPILILWFYIFVNKSDFQSFYNMVKFKLKNK